MINVFIHYITQHSILVDFPSIRPPSSNPRRTFNAGGNAFSEPLPAAVFPRISPAFYKSLKARIVPRLEALYHLVTVPPEAPGKLDHEDLDVVPGHRTPNFVIPIQPDEAQHFAIDQEAVNEGKLNLGQLYI